MKTFTWNEKTYKFDANLCYDTSNLIKLPDGTILSVQEWIESFPPTPDVLYLESYLPGMEPTDCVPATEVTN